MKIPIKEKLGYGLGAFSLDLSYGLLNAFLMNYLTDNLLISSAFMGIVIAVARIWDGFNDPMMGTVVDNTHTKMGRFRPWILIGALLNSVVLVLLFTNPGFAVEAGKVNVGLYAYIAVLYVLWGMTYTMVDIPYWSMVPALASERGERDMISMVARFFSGGGQLVISALTMTMIGLLGSGDENKGYSRWAMVAAAIFFLGALGTVCTTRERIVLPRSEKFTLGKAFGIIRQNDQLLIFVVVAFCFNTGWYLANGLGVYYFKYVMENKGLYSVFAIVVGVGQAIGLLAFPFLSKKLTKFKAVKLAMLVSAVGYLGMFGMTLLHASFPVFAVFAVICCTGIGCMFVSQTVMLADIVDYGEFKLGKRTDSIVFSMKGFLQKMAYTVQALVIGFGLKVANYQENLVPQPDEAKMGISVMMFLLPPVLILIGYLVFAKKYKLHGDYFDTVSAAVNKRHEELHMNAQEPEA